MAVVRKNTLGRFLKKLDKVKWQSIDTQEVAEYVAEVGIKTAQEEYGKDSDVQVDAFIDNNSVKIIAQGDGLAFREFGTGRVGQRSGYPGELPKTDVPITGKWEYYYDSPDKVTVNGKEGWYFGKTFTEGREAGMQMFFTSERLQNELPEKVAKMIKGE